MVEVGDALSQSRNGKAFINFHDFVTRAPGYTIVPASRAALEAGLALYRRRLDKDWSLTDCISFAIMEDERITDALTGDKHFTQAGFRALPA